MHYPNTCWLITRAEMPIAINWVTREDLEARLKSCIKMNAYLWRSLYMRE